MNPEEKDIFICRNCMNEVEQTDDFCTNCGNLFKEDIFCDNHPNKPAIGVCVICSVPYCSDCTVTRNKLFLCGRHLEYEIYEGLARVFGTSDESTANFIVNCLKDAGLHPFLYSRKSSPISIGGPNYTLFRASGEFNGHIINEMKVMVPCQEVLPAEEILDDLESS